MSVYAGGWGYKDEYSNPVPCRSSQSRESRGLNTFRRNVVNARMEVSILGCGILEAGPLSSLRFREDILEKSRDMEFGRMSDCQGGERWKGLPHRGKNTGKVMMGCVWENLSACCQLSTPALPPSLPSHKGSLTFKLISR